jgi:hypothetical protein
MRAMLSKDPIVGFGTAENVANFLMDEAFRYADAAAAYEVASGLFGERIMRISPDPNWKYPTMPTSLADWTESKDKIISEALDPRTAELMSAAWQSSQKDALTCGLRLKKTQKLQSLPDVVGHVVNLTICLESVLNRHLFFLRETGQLDPDSYRSIDRAELMPKLLFCFKNEIAAESLPVSRLKQLVGFRNHSVHYRVDSPDSLAPGSEDLIEIWKQFGSVLALTTGEPTQDIIAFYTKNYISKWIET